MSMRDTVKRVLDQSFGPFGDGTVDRMARYVVAALPDYDAQQARIDKLEGALLLCADYLDQDKPRELAENICRAALKGTDT